MSIEVYPENPATTPVIGTAAIGAAATASPVVIAGTDASAGGLVRALGVDASGNLSVASGTTLADATANTSWGRPLTNRSALSGWLVAPVAFNGTTWDRVRGNQALTLLSAASRTTTTSSADQTNHNSRGVEIFLAVSAIGTGSITLTVETKDPVSGGYVAILTGPIVMASGTYRYACYPGITPVPNANVSDVVGRTWRITVIANNANAVTYSVGGTLIR